MCDNESKDVGRLSLGFGKDAPRWIGSLCIRMYLRLTRELKK